MGSIFSRVGSIFGSITSTIYSRPILFSVLGLFIVGMIVYGIYSSTNKNKKKIWPIEYISNKLKGRKKDCTAEMCAKNRCKSKPVCEGVVEKEPFANMVSDELFVNMQPPCIAHAGLDSDNSFNEGAAMIAALNAGIRSFTLQIDMLDKEKEGAFPAIGEPTLLYRDAAGVLQGKNAGSINSVATAIANAAFRKGVAGETIVPNNEEPILLYLHIVRAPNQIQEPAKHKAYLGKIASALAPLAPVHLGTTALGNFHRQLQEDLILTTPLSAFNGQVIILCNVDTSVFKDGKAGVEPANDLDYWVNMRVYALDSKYKNIGVAQEYSGEGAAAAIITSLDYISALSEKEATSFALKNKTRYVIAMPSDAPEAGDLDYALNTMGVNIVPVDFFSQGEDALDLMDEYDNESWPEKVPALRSN